MFLIGLTGSIGMGKSTAAARFRALGVPVCDADALVHGLYEGDAVSPIEAAFPGVTSGGRVDRQALAQRLLADASGYKVLEKIVHPLVQRAEADCLAVAARGGAKIAILEIPLLFETGGEKRVDATVIVSAPFATQKSRVLQRPGMTEEKFQQVLGRQMPDEEKRRRADYIVDTGGALADTHGQIDRIVADLAGRTGTAYAKYWAV